MNLQDALIQAVIKKGIFYEARNIDLDGDIPVMVDGDEKKVEVRCRISHMTLRLSTKENEQ